MEEKVYVILDNCVWNDEDHVNIIGVTFDEEIAKLLLRDYVTKVKDELNFEELNAIKDSDELNYNDYDEDFIYNESERNFVLFQNGEYNSNHIDISVIEKELVKEYKIEREIDI